MACSACRYDTAGGIGETVEIGSLDLTVVDVEMAGSGRFAALSDANVRVRIRATNARGRDGDVYRLAPFAAFRLDDSPGVGHDPRPCVGCDDPIEPLDLNVGGTVEAWIYFHLDAGDEPKALRHSAPFSQNRASIDLD